MGVTDHLTDPATVTLQQLLEAAAVARLDAELLLAWVLSRTRSFLWAHPEYLVPASSAERYRALIARRAAGEPLAYLCGEREFWSLPLRVSPAVLIPRPETELLVELSLALVPQTSAARVVDLGTGSGAIALSLARERPHWQISATDRSSAALAVARDNAQRLGLTVQFIESDWFRALPQRRFELIVSNPPYVRADDPALDALRHEPQDALTPGPDGLEALRVIIADAPSHLAPEGVLLLEHGADQGAAVGQLLVAAGFTRVRCHSDLAGRDRVSEAHWP